MLEFLLLLIPTVYGLEDKSIHDLTVEQYILYSGLSLMLVIIAGIMSGLTVGLMSIDELELKLKLANGTEEEKRQAFRVLKILKNHHLLLVTLLIANATAMETLPLVLDRMFSQILAVVISVSFVLIFGEVIPQAICIGPNQIKIASKMVPFVKFVICIFFPISWPIAKCLDCCFGKEHHKSDINRLENLKTLIEMHTSGEINFPSVEKINTAQTKIIHGALNVTKFKLSQYMKNLDPSMLISYDTILDSFTIRRLNSTGYNQMLVHAIGQPSRIIGVFKMRDLCLCKLDTPLLHSEISLDVPIFLQHDSTLFDALEILEKREADWVCVVEDLKGMNDTESIAEDILEADSPAILGIVSSNDILDVLMKDKQIEMNHVDESQIFINVIKPNSQKLKEESMFKIEQMNPNDWDEQTENGMNEKISDDPKQKLGLSSDSLFPFI